MTRLHPQLSEASVRLKEQLESRICGQSRAIRNIVSVMEIFYSGLHSSERPIACVLYLGPSGCGKTECVRALAEILHSDKDRLVRINCELLQQEHSVGNLIGSAKGYVGYSDDPLLSQRNIDRHRDPKSPNVPTLLLFDEVDKMAQSGLNVLLGLMDTGRVVLSSGDEVDLRNSLIVCTCNLAARELARELTDSHVGFHGEQKSEVTEDRIWKISKKAVERHMRPELIGRFTKIVTFHALSPKTLSRILEIQLGDIQQRLIKAGHPIVLRLTAPAKRYCLREGISPEYGARPLRTLLDKVIVAPLASILNAKAVRAGDMVLVSLNRGKLVFSSERRKVIVPAPVPISVAPVPFEPLLDTPEREVSLPQPLPEPQPEPMCCDWMAMGC
jgi:ATP-dependent Clp protease ATP-binding subunit ClpA